jgi:hypothetical protein
MPPDPIFPSILYLPFSVVPIKGLLDRLLGGLLPLPCRRVPLPLEFTDGVVGSLF